MNTKTFYVNIYCIIGISICRRLSSQNNSLYDKVLGQNICSESSEYTKNYCLENVTTLRIVVLSPTIRSEHLFEPYHQPSEYLFRPSDTPRTYVWRTTYGSERMFGGPFGAQNRYSEANQHHRTYVLRPFCHQNYNS